MTTTKPEHRAPAFTEAAGDVLVDRCVNCGAVALRRAYRDGWIAAIARTMVPLVGMGAFTTAYRMLLVYTTFWAT